MSEPKTPESQETKPAREIDEQTRKHINRFLQGHEVWNEWANDMLVRKEELEKAGNFNIVLHCDDQGNLRNMSASDQYPEVQDWLDKTYIDFSDICFLSKKYIHEKNPKTKSKVMVKTEKSRIDFNNFIIPDFINFYGAVFQNWTDFSEAIFHGKAIFQNSEFCSLSSFDEVTFYDESNFRNTKFHNAAIFSDVKFKLKSNFKEVNFLDEAIFSRAEFYESSKFYKTRFKGIANFENANFWGWSDFRYCHIKGMASFDSAKFRKHTYFFRANFKDLTFFQQAEFLDNVIFSRTNFNGGTFFLGTKFLANVDFVDVKFFEEADFTSAKFQENAIFKRVDFERHVKFFLTEMKKQADFEAILVKRAFNLAGTKFRSTIPNFTQANFAESPRLDNIEVIPSPQFEDYPFPSEKIQSPLKWQRYWWNLKFRAYLLRLFWRCVYKLTPSNYRKLYHKGEILKHIWNKFTNKRLNPDEEAYYRALKRLAIQAHDHENEMKFFAGEIRSRRHITDFFFPWKKGIASSMRYWAGVFYEAFSDFGRSFIRPTLWWFACLWLFANLTLSGAGLVDTTKCHNSQLTPKQAAYTIGLKNSLLILGLTKTNIVKQAELCLYGLNKNGTNKNGDSENKPKPYDPKIKRTYQAKSTKADTTKTDIPFKAAVQGITHSLLSLLFIFLLLLAIRNQFKIK